MNHYQTICLTRGNGIATLTLNRPDRRNAMNATMMTEIIAALEAEAKSTCGVLILTGTGDAFCAGMDLEHLKELVGRKPEEHRADSERIATLMRALYDFPKPTIAAVNGAAIAGGTGLATICDFTLAAPGVKFGYTEVKIGFVPAIVASFLVMQVGEKTARDLLLTGRLFKSEEALELGLINRIVEHGKLMEEAHKLAKVLLANSPESMRQTKRLLSAFTKDRLDAEIKHAMDLNTEVRRSGDFLEGVSSFLEKRPPDWPSRKLQHKH